MKDIVSLKGVNGNIQLFINMAADFSDVLIALRKKLASAQSFFVPGTTIGIPFWDELSRTEKSLLCTVLEEFKLKGAKSEPEKTVAETKEITSIRKNDVTECASLIIHKNLRNGQGIVFDGAVIVLGDVNAGAQIIAGGDIVIFGTCRGVVHAGAYGNLEATISANKLMATQLRIGPYIARAPEGMKPPEYPETAFIEEEQLITRPATRKH